MRHKAAYRGGVVDNLVDKWQRVVDKSPSMGDNPSKLLHIMTLAITRSNSSIQHAYPVNSMIQT